MARPEITKTPLGKRLREVRKSLGDPDRSNLSKDLGTNLTSLAQYERGDTLPNSAILAEYRNQLNINLNWLLTGDGEMYDAIDSVLEKMSGDTFMADNNDSDEDEPRKFDQSAFDTALQTANEFEAKNGKLMPNDKADIIYKIYLSLTKK